jgi:hypothetical protein
MNPQQPVLHEDLLFLKDGSFCFVIFIFASAPCYNRLIYPLKNLTYYNAPAAAIQYEQEIFQLHMEFGPIDA